MATYVSMIRGINVGGNALVKMQDLKKIFESMGYKNVRTYLQSGNVVFESGARANNLASEIAAEFEKKLGFQVGVIIRTGDELKEVVMKNPFSKHDETKLHVTFLSKQVKNPPVREIDSAKSAGELFSIVAREVYLFLPNGYGRTKLSNNFLEKKLEVSATTRNWKSVNALASLVAGS